MPSEISLWISHLSFQYRSNQLKSNVMRYIVMLGDILNLIKILTLSTTIIYLLIIQQLISIDHFYGDMLII